MSKKVKVGFVGVGGIASVHLRSIEANEDADIVAVCDISEENVQRSASTYNAQAYVDSKQMLENEVLDALFICVPPFAHGTMEEDASAKGIHLMVEKPVSLDVATALRKSEAIRESGIIHATGYCLRYLDTVALVKKYLKNKDIAMISGHYMTRFVQTPWYRDKSKSGGQLVEQATHTLDLMRYFGGEITDIYANMDLLLMNDIPDISIPDVTSVQMKFSSGSIGQMACSFTQPDHRAGIEILGKEFRVVIDGADASIIEEGKSVRYTSKVNFYEAQDRCFIDAVKTEDQSKILSDYNNGVETLLASLAANHSSDTAKPIQIDAYRAIESKIL
ncbi:Gfo/Idh/MocA family protein [Aureibacillus halotolerans]|uniref:Putative dehydrogenase n=1 Tax=Aureibacillus halotolerans TaxID=1508390 RepID=A0A4R6U8V6_9BACI|nr:Gfo/Idh/MocA family oxidoreductase [Aureibacillus halotolerans]TDQ41239.1 putative dehydrogenase [Aureibacillus halotolerans]